MTCQTRMTASGAQIKKRAREVRSLRLKRDTSFLSPIAELDRWRSSASPDSDIALLTTLIDYFNQRSAVRCGAKVLYLYPNAYEAAERKQPGYNAAGCSPTSVDAHATGTPEHERMPWLLIAVANDRRQRDVPQS